MSIEDILSDMKVAWEDARRMLMSKQVKMKEEADKHRRDEQYVVGDRVLLSTRRLDRHASALSDTSARSPSPACPTTRVAGPAEARVRRLQPFHVEKVKRFTPSAIAWSREPPLHEYEVEMLLGKKVMEELVEVRPEDDVGGGVGGAQEDGANVSQSAEASQPPRRSARLAQQGVRVTPVWSAIPKVPDDGERRGSNP